MTARLTVAYAADDPVRLATFWTRLLGRDLDAGPVALRFASRHEAPATARALHLHVTSEGEGLDPVVARAIGAGAAPLEVGQRADEPHVVLADPEGNALCVIPPDSRFLAGCGPLGEVACDGTRQLGLFWAGALEMPLVWDEGEETAIQSPAGGTKVAWGGPPMAPPVTPARQWFELGTQRSLTEEADRLVVLGATLVEADVTSAVLTDPDGNAFVLRADTRRDGLLDVPHPSSAR